MKYIPFNHHWNQTNHKIKPIPESTHDDPIARVMPSAKAGYQNRLMKDVATRDDDFGVLPTLKEKGENVYPK